MFDNAKPFDPNQTIRKTSSDIREHYRTEAQKEEEPQIIGVLAKGGMGTIYEAEQYLPHRKVAIKKVDDPTDTTLQNNLIQEAMIMGSLDHPNIIPIHRILTDNPENPSVVMKLVQGSTFKDQITKGLTHHESLQVMLQVCYAVEYAHQQGIIHRDIKPSNIMIGNFNEIYLLDWGIAIDVGNPNLAIEGFVGSPSFMAPEMISGNPQHVTEKTDIYLLGATLHYAITGKSRYQSNDFDELLKLIEQAKPIVYPEEIPVELGKLINQACHKDPQRRPQSVSVFKQKLLEITLHWEAIQLIQEGKNRAKQCFVTTSKRIKEKLFQKARKDYEYALRIWPESTSAKQGLQFLLCHMISYHIDNKEYYMALHLYDAVDIKDPSFKQKINSLKEQLGHINQEQRRLVALGEANDFQSTMESSAKIAMLIGLGAIICATAANIYQFYLEITVGLELLLISSVVMMLVIGWLMYFYRSYWLKNLAMERMCSAAMGTLLCMSLNRLVALQNHTDVNAVLATDCFIFAFGTLMIAQIISYRYWISIFCCVVGLLATFIPTLALPCLSLISLVVSFGIWWAWRQN